MNFSLLFRLSPTRLLRLDVGSIVAVLLVCTFGTLSGCSSGTHPGGACADQECEMDAGTAPVARVDAGRRDAAVKRGNFAVGDAGASEDLEARVQVNGANVTCGACAVLVVQTKGGKPPYTYEWSDPALKGAGPLSVCPSSPTDYSVIVTDDSAGEPGEFAQPAQQVEVTGSVHCKPDAGTPADDLQGCITPNPVDAGVAPGTDAGAYGPYGVACGDAAVGFDLASGTTGDVTVSTNLAEAFSNLSVLKAGKTYTYVADRFLPLVFSVDKPVIVDVYGATMHCKPAEKLFTLTYDIFTWHQAYCFTPKEDYPYLIVAVHLNGVVFFFNAFEAASVCSGCME